MNSFDTFAFLDDNHINEIINDCKVIGSIDEMSSYYPEYTYIHIAIGNNKFRKELSDQVRKIGFNIVSLISSKSIISKYAFIRVRTVVFPNAVINANSCIGNGCIVSAGAVLDHDAILDDYCRINALAVACQWYRYLNIDYSHVYRKKYG